MFTINSNLESTNLPTVRDALLIPSLKYEQTFRFCFQILFSLLLYSHNRPRSSILLAIRLDPTLDCTNKLQRHRRATTNRDPTNIRLIESPLTFHASLRKRLDDGLCPCYCVIASNGYDRPLLGQEA